MIYGLLICYQKTQDDSNHFEDEPWKKEKLSPFGGSDVEEDIGDPHDEVAHQRAPSGRCAELDCPVADVSKQFFLVVLTFKLFKLHIFMYQMATK